MVFEEQISSLQSQILSSAFKPKTQAMVERKYIKDLYVILVSVVSQLFFGTVLTTFLSKKNISEGLTMSLAKKLART